jgi:class 3 adenylate cyclase
MSESVAPLDLEPAEAVARARAALERHAWTEAFDAFGQADAPGALSGDDLEAYAVSAFFVARAKQGVEIKERAFRAHAADGNSARAAVVAIDIGREYWYMGRQSIAAGWLRRAERLLEAEPRGYAHGWLALAKGESARAEGDIDAALAFAEEAVAIGGRNTDHDLEAAAMTSLGGMKIATGATSAGIQMIEDAAFSAANGELSPLMTGVTYCSMIAACRDLTDYRRASEWTDAAEQWCTRQSVSGFPGVCRVHRAEVTALTGAWDRAAKELEQATIELAAYNAVPPMADGYYAIGEIRLRMGDLDGAEAALRSAHGLGRTPEPALALIRLARGAKREASAAIDAAVAATWDRVSLGRLLPAQVEIALANGDVGRARTAVEALAELADDAASPAMRGVLAATRGRVLLAEGDAAGARRELDTAVERWRDVGAPYEVARARLVLADALVALGDETTADLERQSAHDEFERLGARLDLAAAERAIAVANARRAAPEQVRMTFMFTDIVASTQLAEAVGDAAWSDLLRWHDDALRARIRDHRGTVVNTTGDGFFVAFGSAAPAVACAVAIQQTLVEHRRSSGFALSVRIGLHSAVANRQGDDYSGVGIHVAARVAALAEGGEILATEATLSEAGAATTDAPRTVSVKGVSEPLSVASVAWLGAAAEATSANAAAGSVP